VNGMVRDHFEIESRRACPELVERGRLNFRPVQFRFEKCLGSATAFSLQRPSPFLSSRGADLPAASQEWNERVDIEPLPTHERSCFVSGHDFSRAAHQPSTMGFSPCSYLEHILFIRRACDFLDLSCFLHIQPAVSQTPNKVVILSEALRRSIANKGALRRAVEGPRRCLLADALGGFPAANCKGR
jgi:hypothetical protein